MSDHNTLDFQQYTKADESACLSLFGQNCPQYFAVNERDDYLEFLTDIPQGYYIAYDENQPLAAFGFRVHEHNGHGSINWIMVAQNCHGLGIGKQMMDSVAILAKTNLVTNIDIAASHLSAPFFAHFGAKQVQYIENGWGEGMHRIDMSLLIEQK